MDKIEVMPLLFSFFGGLAIFLFGMNFMSDGLKNLGGSKLGEFLQRLTKGKFRSIMVGTGVTCLIQSSSATSVMVVGFVNAGLLSLSQAIAVVLGADIGTTFTAWMVSIMGKFKITHYALPILAVGFLLQVLAKKKKTKMYGQCLLGFGFLFLGLGTISDGLGPLKQSEYIKTLFATFGANPILGIAIGMIVTMVLQSSSATIAIVQVMALNGIIELDAALALMLGCGIGTTITAHLAAITGTRTSRTLAVSNSLFKIVGTLLFIPFLYNGWYVDLLIWIYPSGNAMVHIAIANSLFNIIIVSLFATVLWKPLLKFSKMLSYGKKKELERKAKYLDPLFIKDPPIAMEQAILELIRMTELAKETVLDSRVAIFEENVTKIDEVREKENVIDELQSAITSYLIKISENDLDTRESAEYPIILHCVNDIEKIGDYSINLVEYVEVMAAKKSFIPKKHAQGIEKMFDKIEEMLDHVIVALRDRSLEDAKSALLIEDEIDDMKVQSRERYIERLTKHKGDPEIEMIIMGIASNIEKMGDHLKSVAIAVAHELHWDDELVHIEDGPIPSDASESNVETSEDAT